MRDYVIVNHNMSVWCHRWLALRSASSMHLRLSLLLFKWFPVSPAKFAKRSFFPSQIKPIRVVIHTCVFVQYIVEMIYVLQYDRHVAKELPWGLLWIGNPMSLYHPRRPINPPSPIWKRRARKSVSRTHELSRYRLETFDRFREISL